MSWRVAVLVLLLWLTPTLAHAQTGAQTTAQEARTYFNAGVRAFKAGRFLAAGQAFMEARKRLDRPELLFSIAQAFRRQYHVDRNPKHLRVAVQHYRLYLDEVDSGGRRADAAEALTQLSAAIDKHGLDAAGGDEVEMTFQTSLMLTSPTPAAQASLDGGPPRQLPLDLAVEPGKHQVVISAEGHVSAKRELLASQGRLAALDIALEPKPGIIAVYAATGATISVNGRLVGQAPLPSPVALPAGKHFVAVTEPGYRPHAEEVTLERGQRFDLDATLYPTDQRVVSVVALVGGAGLLVGAGVLTGLAFERQGEAADLDDIRLSSSITVAQREQFNDTIEERDAFAVAAIVTGGLGGVLTLTGLLLFAFDDPSVTQPSRDDTPDTPDTPTEPHLEVMASATSAAIRLRF